MKRVTVLFFVFLLLVGTMPTFAQDDTTLSDDELELIAFIEQAYANFDRLEYFSLAVTQTVSQRIDAGAEGAMENNGTFDVTYRVQSDRNGEVIAHLIFSTITGTSDMGGVVEDPIELVMIMENRLLNEMVYARFEFPSEELAEAFGYGDAWYSMSRTEFEQQFEGVDISGLDSGGLFSQVGQTYKQFFRSITSESVISIEELPSEIIDNQTMRVFDVQISYLGAISDEEMEAINEQFSQVNEQVPNFLDDMFNAMDQDTSITSRIYIGVDDSLPYRIITTTTNDMANLYALFAQFEPGYANIEVVVIEETTVNISDFDVPFEVEAPAESSPFLGMFDEDS